MAKATKSAKKADSKKAAPGKTLPQKKIKKRQQILKGPHGGMQLVLIEDVNHLGKQGEIVEVKPGYGRNFLLPQGLALIPDPHNLKRLEAYKIQVTKAKEARIADLKVMAEQIARLSLITIEANANDEGHLYGSIGPVEISKVLKGRNLQVEPEMVKIEHPIKEANIGAEVPLALGYGIEAKVQVLVVALSQPGKK